MGDGYFLAFGIVTGLLGLLLLYVHIRLVFICQEEIQAVITSIKVETTRLRGAVYHYYRPKFSYTIDGKTYEGEAPFSSFRKDKYQPYEYLTIYVNKEEPEIRRFPGRIGMFVTGLIFFALGSLFVVLFFI